MKLCDAAGAQEVQLRGRRFATEADISRHISNGFGGGAGSSYIPWLRVQDVPSLGHSRKVHGVKVDRIHHLLSNLEHGAFLAAEFSEVVVDIREQFPLLPRGTAQAIASTLGIRYPLYPKTSLPLVMTTDLLLTVREADGNHKQVAWSVKYTKDLDDLRTVEKLEIEKEFWNSQGVAWSIVTEEQFTIDLINNLTVLRKYADLPKALLQSDLIEGFLYYLKQCSGYGWRTGVALRKIAAKLYITYGDAKILYHYLIWSKRIKIDLAIAPIQTGLPLPFFEVVGAVQSQPFSFGEAI
ncbi:Tn7-like transposition protein A [Pseudomonas fluorescens Pf0-1]|uniref:Tn7-like transposition protein A n=1 Tax=Pseudomonas fluorescens (strain Pf0-1) TaxID=205922 RepID=Q3K446_PSEPF|nr:Tn7-like transposition protein A [Pseudomonas fluorescens Pf0-1]